MPRASWQLVKRWERCVNLPRDILLKSGRNVFLLASIVFLKEIVLELIERPSYKYQDYTLDNEDNCRKRWKNRQALRTRQHRAPWYVTLCSSQTQQIARHTLEYCVERSKTAQNQAPKTPSSFITFLTITWPHPQQWYLLKPGNHTSRHHSFLWNIPWQRQ